MNGFGIGNGFGRMFNYPNPRSFSPDDGNYELNTCMFPGCEKPPDYEFYWGGGRHSWYCNDHAHQFARLHERDICGIRFVYGVANIDRPMSSDFGNRMRGLFEVNKVDSLEELADQIVGRIEKTVSNETNAPSTGSGLVRQEQDSDMMVNINNEDKKEGSESESSATRSSVLWSGIQESLEKQGGGPKTYSEGLIPRVRTVLKNGVPYQKTMWVKPKPQNRNNYENDWTSLETNFAKPMSDPVHTQDENGKVETRKYIGPKGNNVEISRHMGVAGEDNRNKVHFSVAHQKDNMKRRMFNDARSASNYIKRLSGQSRGSMFSQLQPQIQKFNEFSTSVGSKEERKAEGFSPASYSNTVQCTDDEATKMKKNQLIHPESGEEILGKKNQELKNYMKQANPEEDPNYMQKPFADYADFDDCVRRNQDKGNPGAYCGSIKHRVEDVKKGKLDFRKWLQDGKDAPFEPRKNIDFTTWEDPKESKDK